MAWITMLIRGTVFEGSILPSDEPSFAPEVPEDELRAPVSAFELLLVGTLSKIFKMGVACAEGLRIGSPDLAGPPVRKASLSPSG